MTNYTYYTEDYLNGKEAVLDAASFPFWERKASNYIRKYTFGNINENSAISESVQSCVCEVAEVLYTAENDMKDIAHATSEKDGSWSATYESSDNMLKQTETKVRDVITEWLANTGLLYCGG